MKITVYGPGCAKCETLKKNVEKAVAQTGLACDVEKVEGMTEIIAAGVFTTPGLEIDGTLVLQGKVPSPAQLVTIITEHSG